VDREVAAGNRTAGLTAARDWLAAAFEIASVCADFELAREIIRGGGGDASVLESKAGNFRAVSKCERKETGNIRAS